MNILFVTNYFPKKNNTQEAIFLYWRAKELIKAGHKVTVLKWNQDVSDYFMKPYNLLDLNDPILNIDIPVFPIHSIDLMINPLHKKKRYQWIKSNFDIVHFHWLWSMTVFPDIKQWDIPFVITCHGSDIYRMGESFNQWAIGRWLNKKVMQMQMKRLNQANHVIFVSTDIQKSALKKGAKPKNQSVIHNGINNIFNPIGRKTSVTVTVGYVGQLSALKRADKLIEIFYKASVMLHIDQFLIIGEGVLERAMKKEVEKYQLGEKVVFTGKISAPKVAEHMRAMNVLVLPSRQEAFGCVIKEAQASGTPVVGSSNGGIPEVIGHGGRIVQEGENFEERFATAIADLIRKPMDEADIIECAKPFNWYETVKKEINVYENLCGGS
tara:strand:+ start:988 stop:2130 length:1143 start_codon:yes stop_codon:yes gene_type:complete